MNANRHVQSSVIKEAVIGREVDILEALQIDWRSAQHITCPYPGHADNSPSWRWDEKKARAFCTCIDKCHSIFDIVGAREGIDFEAAKIRVAGLLAREDLIQNSASVKSGHDYQATDAESLLNPSEQNRDDNLPRAYLAHRLAVSVEQVLMPSTPVVGHKALGYFDPPPRGSKAKPRLVGDPPCAVFATVSADGRTHAHRIYLAPEGAGKADLGNDANGRPREPKKSATRANGVGTSGCSVVWGDPARAESLLLTEGRPLRRSPSRSEQRSKRTRSLSLPPFRPAESRHFSPIRPHRR